MAEKVTDKKAKSEIAVEQANQIQNDLKLLDAIDKRQKAIDKQFKALEVEQKKIENERNEIMKRIDISVPNICKFIIKNVNKHSSNNSDKEKRNVISGMYRPKPVPVEVIKFLNKIIKGKKLPVDVLDRELKHYPNQTVVDGKIVLGDPILFKLVDFTDDKHISQHALSNIICKYLQHNELYVSPDNKKIYQPDDDVTKILKLKDDKKLSFESFQKRVKRIYLTQEEVDALDAKEEEDESSDNEDEDEEEVEGLVPDDDDEPTQEAQTVPEPPSPDPPKQDKRSRQKKNVANA